MTKANTVTPGDDTSKYQYEPLLETESSLMFFLSEPSIVTTTFFNGADFIKSLDMVKKRISLICVANPWLVGRLVRNKTIHKNVLLKIPKIVTDSDIEAVICSEEPLLSGISTEAPYETVCETVVKSKVMVQEGYKLIGKDDRVAKFSLVQVANGEVAFFLSITHAVADGHTYYKVLSMLTDGAEIEKLSYIRNHGFVPEMKKATGEAELDLMLSPALMMNMIPLMLCGPKAQFHVRFVDEDKVKSAKVASESRCSTNSEHDFACSTNDILTSTFANATKPDLLLMAINLRNRVQVAKDKDAGNYESVIMYDPPSYNTPEIIRRSLRGGTPFIRSGGLPLPGFFKLLRAKFAMITNWAFSTFKADFQLVSAVSSENLMSSIALHLPIYNPAAVVFPVAIIFRPSFGKLAIMYAGSSRDLSLEQLISCGAPIGERLNDIMFSS